MILYADLTKIDPQPDGTLKVYGVASTGARDTAGEVVSPDAMRGALPDYLAFGAIREMHEPRAAGAALSAEVCEDGVTRISAHIVDPIAVTKIKAGVYKGLSIGGKVLSRDADDPTVITRLRLDEISLVDRPCNPQAVIDLWKAAAPPAPAPAPEPEPAPELKPSPPAPDDLRKFAELTESLTDALAKSAAETDRLAKLCADQSAEIARLGRLPLPPRTAGSHLAKAIGKDEDTGAEPMPADRIAKALDALTPAERTHLLMKAALSRPIPL